MYSFKKIFIILIFVFFIFFLSTYSNADFTFSDSLNLSYCKTDLDSINTKLTTAQTTLTSINTSISSTNSYLSTNNTYLSNIYSSLSTVSSDLKLAKSTLDAYLPYLTNLLQIGEDVSDLLDYANEINSKLNDVSYNLTQINSTLLLIYGSILDGQEQTHNDLTTGNEIQQETQNFVKDDTVQDSSMEISTDDYSANDEELATVDNFYISMLETLQQSINGGVSSIVVPLPTGDNLTITSDIVSKHIQGTALYNLIQACWYFVFGSYMIIAFKRLYVFWANGDFDKNGFSGLSYYLDNANTLIHFWEV